MDAHHALGDVLRSHRAELIFSVEAIVLGAFILSTFGWAGVFVTVVVMLSLKVLARWLYYRYGKTIRMSLSDLWRR